MPARHLLSDGIDPPEPKKWTGDMRQGSLFELTPNNAGSPVNLAGLLPSIRAEMHRVATQFGPGRKLLVDSINHVARREAVALSSGGAKSISNEVLDNTILYF